MIAKKIFFLMMGLLFCKLAVSDNKYIFHVINNSSNTIHCNLKAPSENIDHILTIPTNQSSKKIPLDFSDKYFLLDRYKNPASHDFFLICIPDVNPEKHAIWPCKIDIKKMIRFDKKDHSDCGIALFGADHPSQKYHLALIQDTQYNKLIATFTEENLKFLVIPPTQSPANAFDADRVLYEITPNNFRNSDL